MEQKEVEYMGEIVDEIKALASFVEYESLLKNRSKAEKKFMEMLKENTVPYYSAYYSDYMGDDISEVRIIIIDDEGEEHECPQKISERYANSHIKPYFEEGMGIADFMVQLISEGIVPKEFKIIEKVREEINRDRVYSDYKEMVGNITIEHFEVVKQYLLKKLLS